MITDDWTQIRYAFGKLTPIQRRTLELSYFGGLSQREIARQMGVPLGTVKGRVRLGLEKMRDVLYADDVH